MSDAATARGVAPRRPLTTARLVLHPASISHGPAMHVATSASMEHLTPWLAWAEHNTLEQTLQFLAGAEKAWLDGTAFNFTVFVGGEVIGDVGLRRTGNNQDEGNMGYWMAASAAGRGFGAEAAAAVLAFGFDVVGLTRQELRNDVRNLASQRVAEKIGMRREGRLRNGAHGGDAYLYGMTNFDAREDTGRQPSEAAG